VCLSTHTLVTPSTLVAPSTVGWEQLCRRTPKVLRNPLASAPRKLACLALHMFVCCCSVTVRCHAGMGGASATCRSLPGVCFSSCAAHHS